jgi:hypothetical protein
MERATRVDGGAARGAAPYAGQLESPRTNTPAGTKAGRIRDRDESPSSSQVIIGPLVDSPVVPTLGTKHLLFARSVYAQPVTTGRT